MTKIGTLTHAHKCTNVSAKEAAKIYDMLRLGDVDGIDKQMGRVDVYLTRRAQGHKKNYAAGLAIEAT